MSEIIINVPMEAEAMRKVAQRLLDFAQVCEKYDTPFDLSDVEATIPPASAVPTPPAAVPVATPVPPVAPAPVAEIPAAPMATAPTPPAPIVPIATPPVATPPTPAVPAAPIAIELDAEGLPWDERIHAASKKKLTRGNTWKLKRGIQPIVVDQVKAELRQSYPTPEAATSLTPAVASAPAAAPTPAPVAVSPDSDLYAPLMQKCTARITGLTLTINDVTDACTRHGLGQIAELAGRPDLIPVIEAELEAIWLTNTQK